MNLIYPARSDHYDLINVTNANMAEIQNKTMNGDTIYGGTIFSDLNAITKNARGTCYGSATGSPGTSYSWFIDHNNSNVGTVTAYQRAVAYSAVLIVAERIKTGSIWGGWVFNYRNAIGTDLGNTNLGTVTTHKIIRRNGTCEYKLDAVSGTWTAGTAYTVATLDSTYRPSTVKLEKNIQIGFSSSTPYFALLTIANVSGSVIITPRSNMTAIPIRIDETFIVS